MQIKRNSFEMAAHDLEVKMSANIHKKQRPAYPNTWPDGIRE